MQLPGFAGPSYTSQARMAAGERCINLITEPIGGSAPKAAKALLPAPGLIDFATLSDSPGRAIFSEVGRLWAVDGGHIDEIAVNGVVTDRGPVANDGHPAQMTTNGIELGIAAGDHIYILDLTTNVLTKVVDGATFIGQVDDFMVSLNSTTGVMRISESGDGLTWDPAQIAARSATTDPWITMLVSGREIILWGAKTGEVWRNSGASPFPFTLRSDASFEVGSAAIRSHAAFRQGTAWVGATDRGSGGVYAMNGYTPEKISTPALDWEIQQYKDQFGISDAVGWSYEREGHEFYLVSFLAAGKTWCFDDLTGEWTERGKWDSFLNDFTPYRAQFAAQVFGKNIVCDRSSGKLYTLSSLIFTDVGGSVLRRLRQTPHSFSENRIITYHYFELEADRGVGTLAGQGVNPQVEMAYSDNGGQTFGTSLARSVGTRGAYDTRIRWAPCGAGRDRVWQVSSSDPAATRWYDAYIGARVGRI